MDTLKWRLIILSGHFGLLMPLNQQANKGLAVLAGVIDPEYQWPIGLLLPSGGKEDHVWNYKRSIRASLITMSCN